METVTTTTVISPNPSHEADPASFLEAPLRDQGSIEDCLAVGLTGNLTFATLVPVQELHLHVAVRIDLAGVDQVDD